MKQNWLRRPLFVGILASLFLFLLYSSIMIIASSVTFAFDQFVQWWPWMIVLIFGFGTQVGMYVFVKNAVRKGVGGGAIAVSGGLSSVSMVACCAHHLTDVLPLVGLSVLATILGTYQAVFFAIGIVSNAVGMVMMLIMIQKHHLYTANTHLSKLMRYSMRKLLYWVIAISSVFLGIVIYAVVRRLL